MMPQITLSQSVYDKLKGLAEPFTDTPETVIARIADFYISNHTEPKKQNAVPTTTSPANAMASLTLSR